MLSNNICVLFNYIYIYKYFRGHILYVHILFIYHYILFINNIYTRVCVHMRIYTRAYIILVLVL